MNRSFSIGDTAKITGVSQKQIRSWEQKGYISKALRVVSGERAYRRFTAGQVEIISSIKQYLDLGFTLPTAAKKASKGGGNHA